MITKFDIEAAHERIRPYVHRTPVLTSSSLNELTGAELYFKCENFQKIGAFKARGAFNFALQLSENELKNGLCTHSSGNHAQAVALVAKSLETDAFIVMPENAPRVKIDAVREYGAEITFCKPTLEEREKNLERILKQTNATFIPPYDHEWIIQGQATAAKELLEEVEGINTLIAPIGGGGLLAGTALSGLHFSSVEVLGSEPEGADDAFRSLKSGSLIPSTDPNTIADGLLTSVGQTNFPIIRQHVKAIELVSDQEIVQAMRLIWERMKIIIEPSCSLPMAVVIKHKARFVGKRIGIILSGGNVDLEKLPFST